MQGGVVLDQLCAAHFAHKRIRPGVKRVCNLERRVDLAAPRANVAAHADLALDLLVNRLAHHRNAVLDHIGKLAVVEVPVDHVARLVHRRGPSGHLSRLPG